MMDTNYTYKMNDEIPTTDCEPNEAQPPMVPQDYNERKSNSKPSNFCRRGMCELTWKPNRS